MPDLPLSVAVPREPHLPLDGLYLPGRCPRLIELRELILSCTSLIPDGSLCILEPTHGTLPVWGARYFPLVVEEVGSVTNTQLLGGIHVYF